MTGGPIDRYRKVGAGAAIVATVALAVVVIGQCGRRLNVTGHRAEGDRPTFHGSVEGLPILSRK